MNKYLFLFSRDIPLQDVNRSARETTIAVVPGEQERVSDDQRRVSSSDLNSNDVQIVTPLSRKRSKSGERVSQTGVDETPVVMARKDAVYQGSLHNIPLYNEDIEEYNRQMITTSETNGEFSEKKAKKSFWAKLAEQIDLKLLNDAAFALFAVSNFLTSLGFNVPYNYANDVAIDAKVTRNRHWIIMSIGIANCFGRIIIGFLGDRKWVKHRQSSSVVHTILFLLLFI